MAIVTLLSHAEQLAQHLRGELQQGRWTGWMPGVLRLERELGVNRNTVEAALRLLEKQGWLVPRGAGKRRKIAVTPKAEPASMRVAILHYEPQDQGLSYMIELINQLKFAGHAAVFADASLVELEMDPERVSKMVGQAEADAWVIQGGSLEILQWFTQQAIPAFALFGRRRYLPIAAAGPDKIPAMIDMARRLVELGHRRIVLLARRERRIPTPGAGEQAFLNQLKASGITTGRYNLPDWEESVQGLHDILDAMLRITPPTALITDEAPFFTAAMQHLSRRGLRVPEDMSLVCCDSDPNFVWCHPPISHIRWDPAPVVARIVRWANRVHQNKYDIRQSHTKAAFVEGGTIGPAKG